MGYGKPEIYLNQKRLIDMVKVYTIWAAYLKYGSLMKCVMLDDYLAKEKEWKEWIRLNVTIPRQLEGEDDERR